MVRDGARAPPHHEERTSDPPPRAFPIGIAQAPLENLAGILARQLGLDFDVFWHLVIGKRGFQLRADVGAIAHHASFRFPPPPQPSAAFILRHPPHRTLAIPPY